MSFEKKLRIIGGIYRVRNVTVYAVSRSAFVCARKRGKSRNDSQIQSNKVAVVDGIGSGGSAKGMFKSWARMKPFCSIKRDTHGCLSRRFSHPTRALVMGGLRPSLQCRREGHSPDDPRQHASLPRTEPPILQ